MSGPTDVNRKQQPPTPNDRPAVWSLVIEDMKARDRVGRQRYGTPLQPHNGRDALVDAYQEALDLAVYLRQRIAEGERDRARADAAEAERDGLAALILRVRSACGVPDPAQACRAILELTEEIYEI